jgi:hypothetical protein
MTAVAAKHLDPAAELRRRMRTLIVTVPRLLDHHLRPLLGGRRYAFAARMMLRAPSYKGRFARTSDDPQLRNVKSTFLLVGVLYHELVGRSGKDQALLTTTAFLYDLACEVQRQAYFPGASGRRSWEAFHASHAAQMAEGFISANENDGIVDAPDQVRLNVTRCRFHECFLDMGEPALTQAFCRSDETVFNAYSPSMRFHRGSVMPDTIARGASRCVFIYERSPRAPDLLRKPQDSSR